MFGVGGDALLHQRRHVLRAVDLAGLEGGDARRGLGHHAEGDGVEAGGLGAAEAEHVLVARIRLVAVEALELDVAVADELDHLERTGADDLQLVRAGVLLLLRDDHDRRREGRERLHEGRQRALQRDDEGARIRRLPFLDHLEDGAVDAEALVAVERRHDVGRREVLAVVELGALPDLERVDQIVGAHAHRLGELEHRVHVLVAGEQRLEDVHGDIARRRRVGGVLVERGDARLEPEYEIAALARAFEALGRSHARQRDQRGAGERRSAQARLDAHHSPAPSFRIPDVNAAHARHARGRAATSALDRYPDHGRRSARRSIRGDDARCIRCWAMSIAGA
jgi:hypothetical protein